MNLKLRLNLIITTLLLVIMLIGTLLNIVNVRQNVRAEVESTEKLALYLFDSDILNHPVKGASDKPFRLQSLKHMRHLKIEFHDTRGRLVDSNQVADAPRTKGEAPVWFETVMDAVTPKWQSQYREITHEGQKLGRLVITPDPRYEYAEIWKQITDLFVLLFMFFVVVNLMVAWAVGRALEPTSKILRALESLEQGDLKARLPMFELPELSRIGEKFNRMVETLEQSINRNHRLSQQLITLQEAERKSLARDLHDEFGQCLTAIHADSTVVLQVAENRCPEILDSARAVKRLSRHLMELVSGLLQRLRPGVLDELGLLAAVQDLVETWQVRHDKIACRLTLPDEIPDALDEALQITIYRLVQECLTNISRHAEASEVTIALTRTSPNILHVEVQDNGKGFDASQADGFGLPGMRERVEGLGGSLTLQSAINRGTIISANLPVRTKPQ